MPIEVIVAGMSLLGTLAGTFGGILISSNLTNYRIGEACNLLRDSKLSIAEIAVSVGFFDQFYFSRVFKKTKGVPPSRYLSSIEKT